MEGQKKSHGGKNLSWFKTPVIIGGVIVAIITGIFLLLNTILNKDLPAYKAPTPNRIAQTPKNLITDGGFDNGIIGCTNATWNVDIKSWCTNDQKNIVIDTNNNGDGSTRSTSAKLVSNTINSQNTFLFSPAVIVSYGKTYQITYHLNLKHIANGDVFVAYIDEYDADGNDLKTGQYRKDTQRSSSTEETVSMFYHPTSPNIQYARLYFIVTGDSDTLAYIDNVRWIELSR
jgi:hypothetical protein